MRSCNSIIGFVRPSVPPSVLPLVRWSVGPSFMVIELDSVKTRISAPAHPSATGFGCVSGLVEFWAVWLYCSCPTVHNCPAVYPALFCQKSLNFNIIFINLTRNNWSVICMTKFSHFYDHLSRIQHRHTFMNYNCPQWSDRN